MRPIPKILLAGYAVLLVASHVKQSSNHREPRLSPGERDVTVGTVDGNRMTAVPVRIAVFDSAPGPLTGAPAGTPAPPTIILLHGSPGDNGEVTRIARVLAARYRVVAPDLPGFGGSSRRVPDYSIRAHARYVAQLMDSLKLERAHVLGFSMGGGVALELDDIAPQRVASVIMLSAIGVQEYELLGDYHLNHAIHGLQLGGLWAVQELIPHFGALDDGMLTHEYARNFYDTDQRPLRGILERYRGPMLIIQGKNDPLVPPAIAPEHHRIVPQSELLMLEGDHFMAFQRAAELARPIGEFVARVEAGAAATRETADPVRVAAAAEPFDPMSAPAASGIGLAVLLLLIAAATLVSEDLTCIATGLLVSRGTVGFLPGTLACFLGIVIGDLLLYGAGRYLGRPALTRRPLRWLLTDRDLQRISQWFARRGPALVLTTRFIPGTRLPTYVAAGVLHTRFLPFLGYFLLAAALWTPLLVGLAMLYGEMVLTAFAAYRRWSFPLVILAGLALLALVKLVLPLFSWRGRRLLLSRWRRLTRWEFWPRWGFYPPVVAYVLWLGLKHRSLLLFTAANPGIEGGGFVGESKWKILQGLTGAGKRVAATELLTAAAGLGKQLQTVERFVAGGAGWPVVLKPDIGERGAGVAIVHHIKEAERYLEHARGDVLAQQYLPGREFGLFYCRKPADLRGALFSITDKRMPTVMGNGQSTLERLILSDDRAICHARFLLEQHAERLWEVIPAGEAVPLVELGTHCRGATFLDGGRLRTPLLEEAIDRVSRSFNGFCFGRYDVRAESEAALQSGQFQVIELNGVSSEATSIYDPAHGLFSAYRTLFEQWRIAFEIGALNRKAGAPVSRVRDIWGLVRRWGSAS